MVATSALGDLLTTLLERRPFGRRVDDKRPIEDSCLTLLSETAEVSGQHQATRILSRYRMLDSDQRTAFFKFLNDDLDLDGETLSERARAYSREPSPENFVALSRASESKRLNLFRRLNEAQGATAEIVNMREDLLAAVERAPELARTDHDLVHLLRSWFNRGFLVIRRINWDSPASILEKIIAYEAVHQIRTWDDLRLRLQPSDRRCFAFFHPSMPDEPLIFVEVALTRGIPTSVQTVLSESRECIADTAADTAVFYSISNCQRGLAGISFGNSLIKHVASDLSLKLPNIRAYVTLSPIPGLMLWLQDRGIAVEVDDSEMLEQLAAKYLLEARLPDGQPLDQVARFHLGNGAAIHAVHAGADLSENGMAQSSGVMVNYIYDLPRISRNTIRYSRNREVIASAAVKSRAKRAPGSGRG